MYQTCQSPCIVQVRLLLSMQLLYTELTHMCITSPHIRPKCTDRCAHSQVLNTDVIVNNSTNTNTRLCDIDIFVIFFNKYLIIKEEVLTVLHIVTLLFAKGTLQNYCYC